MIRYADVLNKERVMEKLIFVGARIVTVLAFLGLVLGIGAWSVGAEVAAVTNSQGEVIIQPGFESRVTTAMGEQLRKSGHGAALLIEGSGYSIKEPVSNQRTIVPTQGQVQVASLSRSTTSRATTVERTLIPADAVGSRTNGVMTPTQASVVGTYAAAAQVADTVSPEAARSAERMVTVASKQEQTNLLTAAKARQMDAKTAVMLSNQVLKQQKQQLQAQEKAQEEAHDQVMDWVDVGLKVHKQKQSNKRPYGY